MVWSGRVGMDLGGGGVGAGKCGEGSMLLRGAQGVTERAEIYASHKPYSAAVFLFVLSLTCT